VIRAALNGLYRLSGWLAAFFILAICLLVFAQVLLNLVDRLSSLLTGSAIGLAIPSYADFTGFFLAAASFFALAHTLREGGHIRVSLLIQCAGPAARRIIELWCTTLATAVTIYFSYYTAALVRDSYTYNDLSSGMIAVPIWIPQSALLAGLVVLAIALLDDVWAILRGLPPSYHDKGENLLQHPDSPAQSQD